VSGSAYYDDCPCGERFHESALFVHWPHALARLREVEEWMLEAKLAIEAATVIAEREGCHLNLGNHDRLVREYEALSTERTPT